MDRKNNECLIFDRSESIRGEITNIRYPGGSSPEGPIAIIDTDSMPYPTRYVIDGVEYIEKEDKLVRFEDPFFRLRKELEEQLVDSITRTIRE